MSLYVTTSYTALFPDPFKHNNIIIIVFILRVDVYVIIIKCIQVCLMWIMWLVCMIIY